MIFLYVRFLEGIKFVFEEYVILEGIKKRFRVEFDGILWFDWDRVEIIIEDSERVIIEIVYEFLGFEKGKEFFYFWGKK